MQTGAVSQVLYYQQNIVTPGAGEALSVEATVKVVSSSTSSAARTAIGITAIRGANVGMTLFLDDDAGRTARFEHRGRLVIGVAGAKAQVRIARDDVGRVRSLVDSLGRHEELTRDDVDHAHADLPRPAH